MRRSRRLVLVAALVVGLGTAACGSDQDPGFDAPSGGAPGSTGSPRTLGACPPGGPDSTTPPAGCLDAEGNVLHATP